MPDREETESERPRRGRRWWKRLAVALLAVVALLAAFHRPLLFGGARHFAIEAARREHLALDFEMGGSIFSTLWIANLRAVPTAPGPVRRLEIGRIDLAYSLWGWVRGGLPALLKRAAVRDAIIEITPDAGPPPEKRPEPGPLRFPELFPETLEIENVSFRLHAEAGDTVIEGLWFTLLPDRPGVLRVGKLEIPGVRTWTDISGATTFRDRNLVLSDLNAGAEIRLARFNLDASQLDDAKLGIGLEGSLFGAETALAASVSDLNATNHLAVKASVKGLVFDGIWKTLGIDPPVLGTLEEASVDFAGLPERPSSWTGTIAARVTDVADGSRRIGDLALDARLADGRAGIESAVRVDAKNSVSVEAGAELPDALEGFAGMPARGAVVIALADLAAADLPGVRGDAGGRIDFRIEQGWVFADAVIHSDALTAGDAEVARTDVTLHAEKDLRAPPFENLRAKLAVGIASARVQDYATDAVDIEAGVDGVDVSLDRFTLARGPDRVSVSGHYALPEDMRSFAGQPWQANLEVEAPELQALVAEGAATKLGGALKIAGKAQSSDGAVTGDFTIAGREIAFNGLKAPVVDGKLHVADGHASLTELAVIFDEANSIKAAGEVELSEPYPYQGSLDARLADLAIFGPLAPEPLAGSLTAEWRGSGDATGHSGSAAVALTNGQFGAQAGLNAEVRASYTPEMIDVPVLRAAAEMGGVASRIHWENRRLTISGVTARLKDLTVLTGSLALPLDLAHFGDVDQLIPNDGPVSVALKIPELSLAAIFRQLGRDDPPITGTVSGGVTAGGTIADLAAGISLRASNLASSAAQDVQPANVALDVALRDDRLAVNGTITEPRIQPLVVSGGLPLDVVKIKHERRLDPDTPVQLSVRMPRSPLGFVAALTPAIRFIDGTAAIDVAVTGTLGAPRVAGTVEAGIDHLRLSDERLPPIGNVILRLDSTTERVTISQFRGEIAGGAFGGQGTIAFTDPAKPVFNLAFGTKDALLLQDEAITLRVSSRIEVTGPLDSASVTGKVFVTRSRFTKDIDILPIGLPGRPAPEPPEAPVPPGISEPPLRDWKFDIAIRTADPFLVQGNLANGKITIDLRVGGTGMAPWVDGGVRIEQLETSLPFSTLSIRNGLVYFERDQPFLPQFDIRGTSQIRDYDITAYIYGTMADPQANFSSDPPLPQSEIVALMATGVTSKELSGNPSVLAGKAAMLLVQKLYRSVFKRGQSGPAKDTLLSRFDFDVGVADPKTGRQAATVRFPLTDNIVLMGGVDVSGNFRGQVKYLIRFR